MEKKLQHSYLYLHVSAAASFPICHHAVWNMYALLNGRTLAFYILRAVIHLL